MRTVSRGLLGCLGPGTPEAEEVGGWWDPPVGGTRPAPTPARDPAWDLPTPTYLG